MKTIVKQIALYRFGELSPDAKERAKQKEMELFSYPRADKAVKSLLALADHFGCGRRDYSVDWFDSTPSWARFDMPEMDEQEIADRLAELGSYNSETLHGNGDCKLTGWCYDESAIDGFRISFIRDGERDLQKLMQAAFRQWLKECQEDCEWHYSDEAFSETCDANGFWFTEDGTFYEADLGATDDEILSALEGGE